MRVERPEPILPAHDLAKVRDFYKQLGFSPWFNESGYEILSRGNLVIHFEERPDINPDQNRNSCYWRVKDADALYREFAKLGLPEEGYPRLTAPADESWGMREFTLKDPAGNLVRVGHDLDPDAAYQADG